MKRGTAFLVLIVIGIYGIFAEDEMGRIAFNSLATLAALSDLDPAVPGIPVNIRNNTYYLESRRLTALAQETYDTGDYDASVEYATEAIEYAHLSDEYVALQLKIKAADDAIQAAYSRLGWAATVDAPNRYPDEFTQAQNFYDLAVTERSAEHWDEAIEAANQVLIALANVQEAPPVPEKPVLPAQYTVRSWAVSKDCLWNIAGRPGVYGDPTKWRLIYEANRSRLPNPNNPNLIRPGMVLTIPSIKGEVREGMWDPSTNYDPLQ
jgi:tetratricopeptide (TPR) repeat protein